MANYSNLKAAIAAAIKQNGNQEITGQVLQNVLTSMVSVIGANYTFAGVATPSTNPGTPDQNVVYMASQAGMYTNFGGIQLPAGISLLMWNGSWTSKTVMCGDGGVFDISVYKSSGGTLATYADLAAALDGGNNIPVGVRKGGMSVKFVQSSDNKYVQYRYMGTAVTGNPNPFLNTANWQGVDNYPVAGSDNIVKSGGVYQDISGLTQYPGTSLSPARTIENAKLIDDTAAIMAVSQSTNILFFNIGANMEFNASGISSIDCCQVLMLGGSQSTTFAPWKSIKNGNGTYSIYGKTTQTQQYVAITVDKNSTYSVSITKQIKQALEEEINRAESKETSILEYVDDNFNNIYSELFKSKTALSTARIISDAKVIANLSDNTLLAASTTTDVVIFEVGADTLFNAVGNSDITDSAIALVAGTQSTDFGVNKKILVDSNYNYYGKTTQSMQFVAMTVKKNTDYNCYVKESTERESINVFKTDTDIQVLTKMIAAVSIGNCDVVFEKGEYVLQDVYLYMRDTLEWTWSMELPIGNNCRYFFNGSTIISNQPTETYDDTRNILGCKGGSLPNTNFELHDGILINNGGIYCVHDECGLSDNSVANVHKYYNMRMTYNQGSATQGLSKCIGGGAGFNTFVVIENCVFYNNGTSNPSAEDVSWHSVGTEHTDPVNVAFFIEGNYFSRKFRIGGQFNAVDSIFVKYDGNSHKYTPSIDDTPTTVETILFNNVTRE